MLRCQYCNRMCMSSGGLSNHINACRERKFREMCAMAELNARLKVAQITPPQIITHNTIIHNAPVYNNCTFTIQYINTFHKQCESFATKIAAYIQSAQPARLINEDPCNIDRCVEYIRESIRACGSDDDKHILDQLENGEVHLDEDLKDDDNARAELEGKLQLVDEFVNRALLSVIQNDAVRQVYEKYLKDRSVFERQPGVDDMD